MDTSNLLIPEPPLQVLPSLAVAVGLGPAIILQQIHYWCVLNERAGKRSTHFHDGRWWTYAPILNQKGENSDGFCWAEQFPFWSKNTIYRHFKTLRDEGLVYTGNFSDIGKDTTLWYAVNYAKLAELGRLPKLGKRVYPEWGNGFTQNGETLNTKTNVHKTTNRDNTPSGNGHEAERDLFGNTVLKKGTFVDLEGTLSVSELTTELLNALPTANNAVAFLRFAYCRIFNADDSTAPPFKDIGKLYRKAASVCGGDRQGGEALIRLWVMHTITDTEATGESKDPLLYAADKLDNRRKAKRTNGFQKPDLADVKAYFAKNGSNDYEAERWYNWMESRAWDGVHNWKPLAKNRAKDVQGPNRRVILDTQSEAIDYWEKNRASSRIPFDKFFRGVDSRGRKWNPEHPDNKGQKPRWELIATTDMVQ